MNEIVSLMALSDLSLLVYGNAVDLSVLSVYPETYHSLMSFKSLLGVSLEHFLGVDACHLHTGVV